MAKGYQYITQHLDRILQKYENGGAKERLQPKFDCLPPKIPGGTHVNEYAVLKRWKLLEKKEISPGHLFDRWTQTHMKSYQQNIENFIGTVKVPVGLAGPLRVNGMFAQGDYYLPLATTEAALVASYSRGAFLISKAGGCSVSLISEGISRAPGFAFKDIHEAGLFISWCLKHLENFRCEASKTTNYGKLLDMQVTAEGNHVYLNFEYTTGDASGQNMVTIATQAICDYIAEHCPITPQYYFIEANLSGDKKATAQSFQSVRGKKVTAEIQISKNLIEEILHTSVEQMVRSWSMSALGGVMSGAIGVHGHYANGLAALYIATGQDAACVAESAVGVTRLEITPEGNLYAAVTLPNLIVGTVGGGTKLPTQQECLKIMGLNGPGNVQAFAEVCAALALAGELSIKGAICSHQFTRAHQRLARNKQKKTLKEHSQ